MDDCLLNVQEAARRLGIQPATLYDWLSRSDYGLFILRGQCVSINYLQGGAKGQGRIQIEASEVARIKDLMRAQPIYNPPRRQSIRCDNFPGINVPLGRPDRL